MKNLKIVFVLLFLSFNLLAQKDFNRSIISNNSILKCSEYLVVPKTNPDYYKKPIGLVLKAEFFFDINGNVIKYFSPNGAVTSLSESKDLKEYYIYKDNRIVRMSRVDFDSTSVQYLYFDKRYLICKIKTNDKNERIGIELIYSNSSKEKELKKIEIDFHNTTELNNSVHLDKSNITYSKNIKKLKVSRKLMSISKEQLYALKTSIDIEKIENLLNAIEKSIAIDTVNFETLSIYNEQKQLIKEVSEGNTIEYVYNKKGLLISCIDKNKKYSFKSKFIYTEK